MSWFVLVAVVFSLSGLKAVSANKLVHVAVNFVMVALAEDRLLVSALLASLAGLHIVGRPFLKLLRFFVEARVPAVALRVFEGLKQVIAVFAGAVRLLDFRSFQPDGGSEHFKEPLDKLLRFFIEQNLEFLHHLRPSGVAFNSFVQDIIVNFWDWFVAKEVLVDGGYVVAAGLLELRMLFQQRRKVHFGWLH